LDDIYTYEGKEWTFMYDKTIVKPTDEIWKEDNKTQVIELDKPIKKIFIVEELDKDGKVDLLNKACIPPFPGPEWTIKLIEPEV
jgi:hypothetical protein